VESLHHWTVSVRCNHCVSNARWWTETRQFAERCTSVRRTFQTCSVVVLGYQRRVHVNAGKRCALCLVFGWVSAGVLTAVNPDRRGTNSGSDVIRMAPVRQVWSRHSCLPETGSGAMSYFLAPSTPCACRHGWGCGFCNLWNAAACLRLSIVVAR